MPNGLLKDIKTRLSNVTLVNMHRQSETMSTTTVFCVFFLVQLHVLESAKMLVNYTILNCINIIQILTLFSVSMQNTV